MVFIFSALFTQVKFIWSYMGREYAEIQSPNVSQTITATSIMTIMSMNIITLIVKKVVMVN